MEINGLKIVINGKLIRVARVRSELYTENEKVFGALEEIGKKVKADLFTFIQNIPLIEPKYKYHTEYDNVAVIPLTTFDEWWKVQVNDKTRNMARKAGKSGVVIRQAVFNRDFAEGIKSVYDETPIRQGRKFWHYGKSLEEVERENGTFLDRSVFVGAYLGEQLIGFIKIVFNETYGAMMQIISRIDQRDKAPTNALIAEAVKICCERKCTHLVYAKYTYGAKGEDSLTDFKKHNAFTQIDLPRYWIPLTLKGKAALALNLHKGLKNILPQRIVLMSLKLRNCLTSAKKKGAVA